MARLPLLIRGSVNLLAGAYGPSLSACPRPWAVTVTRAGQATTPAGPRSAHLSQPGHMLEPHGATRPVRLPGISRPIGQTGRMEINRIEKQDIPDREAQQPELERRSLGLVLLQDLNTVATGVATGVTTGVLTAKVILHINKGDGDGGSPPAAGESE